VNGWVIAILHDGPARLELFGDAQGQPFPTQDDAERTATLFPRRGASYSVYVTQIGRT
jgi:hypothetical protein